MSAPVLPSRPVIGVLHPGVMGAALGSALKRSASAVVWAAAGRSITTSRRAELADLVGVPDVAALARRADVIVSVCPPHAALDVARQVAEGRGDRRPLFVDANAVSPATVARIGTLLGVEHVVDGAVVGPPAWEPGRTVLWLAGRRAPEVAGLFTGTPFEPRELGPEPGPASALAACLALQSTAVAALRAAMAEAADRYGVAEALRDELHRTGAPAPDVPGAVLSRAWRWVGEMEEAGDALAAVGVPDGFSRAAAEMFRRLAALDPTDRANAWNLRG